MSGDNQLLPIPLANLRERSIMNNRELSSTAFLDRSLLIFIFHLSKKECDSGQPS